MIFSPFDRESFEIEEANPYSRKGTVVEYEGERYEKTYFPFEYQKRKKAGKPLKVAVMAYQWVKVK